MIIDDINSIRKETDQNKPGLYLAPNAIPRKQSASGSLMVQLKGVTVLLQDPKMIL